MSGVFKQPERPSSSDFNCSDNKMASLRIQDHEATVTPSLRPVMRNKTPERKQPSASASDCDETSINSKTRPLSIVVYGLWHLATRNSSRQISMTIIRWRPTRMRRSCSAQFCTYLMMQSIRDCRVSPVLQTQAKRLPTRFLGFRVECTSIRGSPRTISSLMKCPGNPNHSSSEFI